MVGRSLGTTETRVWDGRTCVCLSFQLSLIQVGVWELQFVRALLRLCSISWSITSCCWCFSDLQHAAQHMHVCLLLPSFFPAIADPLCFYNAMLQGCGRACTEEALCYWWLRWFGSFVPWFALRLVRLETMFWFGICWFWLTCHWGSIICWCLFATCKFH